MKTLKKVLCLVLALVMVVGTMAISVAAFDDDEDVTYKDAAAVLNGIGVITGYDGKFDPKGTLTRDQGAAIIVRLLQKDNLKLTSDFTDVKGLWSEPYVAYLASQGMVSGYGDGKYGPADPLTGAQFAKMLLTALGYNAKAAGLEGANWEANTVSLAEDLGITWTKLDTTANVTREQAAQMAFKALTCAKVKYNNTTTIDLGGIGTISTTAAPTYQNKTFAEDFNLKVVLEDDDETIARNADDKHVTLAKTAAVDEDGNPYAYFMQYAQPRNKYFTVEAEPVATFTTAMTEGAIFNEIGAEGLAGLSRHIVFKEIYVDGVLVAKGTNENGYWENDKALANYDHNLAETVVIAKGDRSNAAGFGNGVVAKVYATDKANIYTLTINREYLGVVSSVTKANANTGAKRYITIAGKNYITDEFKKNDVVLYTLGQDDGAAIITSVVPATTVSGTVSKITNNSVYTIGDSTYKLSNNYNVAPALKETNTWYLDSNGYIIGAVNATVINNWNYAVMTGYANQTAASENLLGAGAKTAAEKYQFVGVDGKTVVMDGAFDVTSAGVYTWTLKDAASNSTQNTPVLVRYTVDEDGKVEQAEKIAVETGVANATDNTVARGVSKFDGKYVTSDTLFFFKGKDSNNNAVYKVYKGYTTIPATTSFDAASYFFVEKNNQIKNDTIAAVLVDTNRPLGESTVVKSLLYVPFTAVKNVSAEASGTVTNYSGVYVAAETSNITLKGAEDLDIGGIYSYEVNENNVVITATKLNNDGPATVERVDSTYVVVNGNTKYVGSNTKYFAVDADTGVVTAADAVPAGTSTTDTKLLYIAEGDAVNTPATIVYFTVVAK